MGSVVVGGICGWVMGERLQRGWWVSGFWFQIRGRIRVHWITILFVYTYRERKREKTKC